MICAPAAGRPAFRVGVRDRSGRKHREDSADDHISKKKARSLCGRKGHAQSTSGEALARRGETQRRVRDVSRKRFERTAVIARCGIRHRPACRASHAETGRRRERRPREQCAILHLREGRAKSLSFAVRSRGPGSRNEEVQCLCGIGLRLRAQQVGYSLQRFC
jgi:hypothetical protein